MALKVEVSASCEIDLEQAYQWYESQRAQLGLEFLNDFEERLNLIAVNPYIGVDHVKVVACLHGGLNPRLSFGTLRNRVIEQ